jgi:hypothetical protein
VTGNWGCGAFAGLLELKFVVQVVAGSLAGKQLVYCYFDQPQILDFWKKVEGKTVGQLANWLLRATNVKLEDWPDFIK